MALKPVDFVAVLALPSLRMPLLPTAWKVAVPFSGIDAVGAAIEKRKLLAQVVNHVEKNARLLEYLRGVTGNPQLQATDALLMQLSDLVPSSVEIGEMVHRVAYLMRLFPWQCLAQAQSLSFFLVVLYSR